MKKIRALPILLVLLGLIFSGCSVKNGKIKSTALQGDNDILKVRVAAQPTSGQVFQFLAADRGYLQEEKVDVELVYINNATDAFSALNSGQVDIISTYGTGGPLIQIANGQEFSVFGGYMLIGATPVFAMPGTEYKGLESFRNKKIAIMRGGTPDIVLKGLLHDFGFDIEKDVTFVEMKRNPDVMEAVRNRQVDFGAVSTGFELQIAAAGMNIVLWPDELWPNHSCCRMLAKTNWLKENPESVKRLLRAYLRAERDMESSLSRVVELTVENLDLSRETAESFLLSEHMIYETDPYRNSVVKMWNKMNAFGYIKDSSIKIDDHIDIRHYKAALDSLLEEQPKDKFYQEKLAIFNANNF